MSPGRGAVGPSRPASLPPRAGGLLLQIKWVQLGREWLRSVLGPRGGESRSPAGSPGRGRLEGGE